jgi:hypothetical protein
MAIGDQNADRPSAIQFSCRCGPAILEAGATGLSAPEAIGACPVFVAASVQFSWPPASRLVSAGVQIPMSAVTAVSPGHLELTTGGH